MAFSLEPFVMMDSKLLTWADAKTRNLSPIGARATGA
jgi:hypothetical protein